jgi:hypothetical protein
MRDRPVALVLLVGLFAFGSLACEGEPHQYPERETDFPPTPQLVPGADPGTPPLDDTTRREQLEVDTLHLPQAEGAP